jgi:hypothetical protein
LAAEHAVELSLVAARGGEPERQGAAMLGILGEALEVEDLELAPQIVGEGAVARVDVDEHAPRSFGAARGDAEAGAAERTSALPHGVAGDLAPKLGKTGPAQPGGGPAGAGVAGEGDGAAEAAAAADEQRLAFVGL